MSQDYCLGFLYLTASSGPISGILGWFRFIGIYTETYSNLESTCPVPQALGSRDFLMLRRYSWESWLPGDICTRESLRKNDSPVMKHNGNYVSWWHIHQGFVLMFSKQLPLPLKGQLFKKRPYFQFREWHFFIFGKFSWPPTLIVPMYIELKYLWWFEKKIILGDQLKDQEKLFGKKTRVQKFY